MKKRQSGGLANVVAGATAICTVGSDGHGLTYRGYRIEDLAAQANFEEVAYLLMHGDLPNADTLRAYRARLAGMRELPAELKSVLEQLPSTSHPMDVLRTACSALGCLEPEDSFDHQFSIADRLLASLPSMLLYWYRYHRDGVRIETVTADQSVAEHFLHLLTGASPLPLHVKVLDVSLTLYAEHEFNASTFAARVAASTLSDFYSCITAAIGTLRGPLHGGANEAAMALISRYDTAAAAETGVRDALARKEKIMGFGHRVYQDSDPRSAIIKAWAEQLSQAAGDTRYFAVSEQIERVMWETKRLFPNLDFYSASAYFFLKIPVELYTPIFVCSRITGWAAHVFEQRANNALIRPSADYCGPPIQSWVPLASR